MCNWSHAARRRRDCAGHGPSLKGKGAGDMPSIPQSLLWISLVVLWLFVLVPMLISKRDTVRRTSDVALATRVLNGGDGAHGTKTRRTRGRASQRPGLAADRRRSTTDRGRDDAGRRSRRWRVAAVERRATRAGLSRRRRRRGGLRRAAGRRRRGEQRRKNPSAELPTRGRSQKPSRMPPRTRLPTRTTTAPRTNTSTSRTRRVWRPRRSRRLRGRRASVASPRYESKTAAAVSARKYRFRKRVLTAMAVVLVAAGAARHGLRRTAGGCAARSAR